MKRKRRIVLHYPQAKVFRADHAPMNFPGIQFSISVNKIVTDITETRGKTKCSVNLSTAEFSGQCFSPPSLSPSLLFPVLSSVNSPCYCNFGLVLHLKFSIFLPALFDSLFIFSETFLSIEETNSTKQFSLIDGKKGFKVKNILKNTWLLFFIYSLAGTFVIVCRH